MRLLSADRALALPRVDVLVVLEVADDVVNIVVVRHLLVRPTLLFDLVVRGAHVVSALAFDDHAGALHRCVALTRLITIVQVVVQPGDGR